MDEERAAELGAYLRKKRQEMGYSTRAIAMIVGTDQSTIVRIEKGQIRDPRGDLLAHLAEVLHLPMGDVLTMAGYRTTRSLPSLRPYMRAKFRDLPSEAVDEVEAFVEDLRRRHGLDGPAPGEDE